MNQIKLRDRNNRLIGIVEVSDNGDKKLRDRNNRLLGYYYARQNVTRDRNNKLIGKGDILTSLLDISNLR